MEDIGIGFNLFRWNAPIKRTQNVIRLNEQKINFKCQLIFKNITHDDGWRKRVFDVVDVERFAILNHCYKLEGDEK